MVKEKLNTLLVAGLGPRQTLYTTRNNVLAGVQIRTCTIKKCVSYVKNKKDSLSPISDLL